MEALGPIPAYTLIFTYSCLEAVSDVNSMPGPTNGLPYRPFHQLFT
jgi:hypothetical protein